MNSWQAINIIVEMGYNGLILSGTWQNYESWRITNYFHNFHIKILMAKK